MTDAQRARLIDKAEHLGFEILQTAVNKDYMLVRAKNGQAFDLPYNLSDIKRLANLVSQGKKLNFDGKWI